MSVFVMLRTSSIVSCYFFIYMMVVVARLTVSIISCSISSLYFSEKWEMTLLFNSSNFSFFFCVFESLDLSITILSVSYFLVRFLMISSSSVLRVLSIFWILDFFIKSSSLSLSIL